MKCLRPLEHWDRGFESRYGAWMFVCVYSVFVLSCVSSGLGEGWSLVQVVLPTVYKCKITEPHKKRPRPDTGCKSRWMDGWLTRLKLHFKEKQCINFSLISCYVKLLWTISLISSNFSRYKVYTYNDARPLVIYFPNFLIYLWRFREQWAENFSLGYRKYCNVFGIRN
jgi:hypothetical protein